VIIEHFFGGGFIDENDIRAVLFDNTWLMRAAGWYARRCDDTRLSPGVCLEESLPHRSATSKRMGVLISCLMRNRVCSRQVYGLRTYPLLIYTKLTEVKQRAAVPAYRAAYRPRNFTRKEKHWKNF